jgi:hypothetical protein
LADTGSKVFIEGRTELYILRLFFVTEQTLGRLVEAFGDMFEGVGSTVFGTTKLILHRDEVAKRGSRLEITNLRKRHGLSD